MNKKPQSDFFQDLNLPLKNPIKNHENTKKKSKSITNQQNPYQYDQIHIQKISNNPNPSKFRNPKFGEITNHKTNLEVGCGGASSRNGMCGGICGGVELR